MGYLLGAVLIVLGVFPLLFLGGLCSAALEIRRERRAGLVPTRPAWDQAAKRRALGGIVGQVRAAWNQARHAKMRQCWCGQGPLAWFPALDAGEVDGLGCAAWESGDPVAIMRHAAAGGYARTPQAVAS